MINGLYAHNQHSGGSKELSTSLEIPRLKHENSKFVGKPEKTILNWGSTNLPPEVMKCRIPNRPERVAIAVDKLACFNIFRDRRVSSPEFFTDIRNAERQLEQGHMIFARTLLRGHSGNGISIMDPDHPDTWGVNAPLYVKYIPKKDEYRVHVMAGNVIDVQRKGLREELRGREGVNFKIRNLANGFVYVRNDNRGIPLIDSNTVPDLVKQVAVHAVTSLELDFGAADLIWNERAGRAYCLEVNTGPVS